MTLGASTDIARVVVIGLDMGDGGLIRAWARAGHLPNLDALIAHGTWLDLESPARVLHTSSWPTFATGALPGRHGVYYPYQPKPGCQQAQLIEPDQYGAPCFWHLADRQERRCLIYDVPETFPEAGFRGRAIFEWGTWAWYGQQVAQPSRLLDDLRARFGPYPLGMEAKHLGLARPDLAVLEERLPRSVEYKCRSLKWLMEQERWDLVVTAFCETHSAGHYLWPALPADTADPEAAQFRPLRQVYAAIDRAIGELRATLPPDVILIVVSGDGVRPNRCGWHLLPDVLERLGYTNAPAGGGDANGRAGPRSALGTIKGLVPERARRWIADSLPWWLRDRIGAHLQSSQIDWSRTRAFALPTDLEGCIRINLKGREPAGIVEPGSEYEDLCQEIRLRLAELVNPASGEPAVSEVSLLSEVFPGERQDYLPDIVVAWNDRAPIAALQSPRLGLIEGASPDPRTGTHSPSGFLLAHGLDIAQGKKGEGRLVQVAPSVLRLMGLDAGPEMDGGAFDAFAPPDPVSSVRVAQGSE